MKAGIIERDDSFVGFVPQTGVVATPSRTLQPKEVSTFIQAIRDRASLEISYQSMRKDTASTRSVSPHALGFDGLRWHVRRGAIRKRSSGNSPSGAYSPLARARWGKRSTPHLTLTGR